MSFSIVCCTKRRDVIDELNSNPVLAIVCNQSLSKSQDNCDRVIDTLRLFIDLVDVLSFDDYCESSALMLSSISVFSESTGNVFSWLLETLGPDLWESYDGDDLHHSIYWLYKKTAKQDNSSVLLNFAKISMLGSI